MSEEKKGVPKGLKTLLLFLWVIFGLGMNFLYAVFVVFPGFTATTPPNWLFVFGAWAVINIFWIIVLALLLAGKLMLKILGKIEDYVES